MNKLRPTTLGTICCAVAAFFYSGSGICIRQVSTLNCDPSWCVCVKESFTALVIGPWLIYRALRGLPVLPPARILLILVVAGLANQLMGNLGWQWAVGIVGLSITVPASFGTMITSVAILGLIILRERVTGRSIAAIGVFMVSLVFLSLGAEGVDTSVAAACNIPPVVLKTAGYCSVSAGILVASLAVAAAGVAGVVYGLLSIAIRHTMIAGVQQSTLMFIIPGIALITLGPISVYRQGFSGLLATPWEQLAWMLAAGMFNIVGFMAVTKGLHLTTVVHANVLNASQVAIAAVAGMLIFREPPNFWLVLGVCLTLLGIFVIDRPAAEEAVDQAI